jgi:hypothetical protein
MGLVDWLVNIDPSARVVTGFALVVVALVLFVLRLSYTQAWAARQPAHRPAHAPRWYRRQQSAEALTGRLRFERLTREAGRNVAAVLYEATDPVGRPLNLAPATFDGAGFTIGTFGTPWRAPAAEPDQTWLADAFVDTQTIERVT